jgi:hypothetical protein
VVLCRVIRCPTHYHALVNYRKITVTLIIVFAIWFMFSEPKQAAHTVRATGGLVWNLLSNGASSFQAFVTELTR